MLGSDPGGVRFQQRHLGLTSRPNLLYPQLPLLSGVLLRGSLRDYKCDVTTATHLVNAMTHPGGIWVKHEE